MKRNGTDTAVEGPAASPQPISGARVGLLIGFDKEGDPLVDFPGNVGPAIQARTTVPLAAGAVGTEIVMIFEQDDPQRPIILGLIQKGSPSPAEARVDGERVVLTGDREIVLRCGHSSITLTRAGKILIRGKYLLSRSSGVNRIKGGSVQIN